MPSDSRRRSFGSGIESFDGEISPEQYFARLRKWLDLEAEAERARLALRRQMRSQSNVERTGETIVSLDLTDHRTGLAGRYLLDFRKAASGPLPMNRLKVGSPVVVSDDDDPSDEGVAGVVSRRGNDAIEVATDAFPEGRRFRIDLSPDETTRRRQVAAMARVEDSTGRVARIRDVILGRRPLRFNDEPDVRFVTSLNPPQEDAVRFALSARDVAILHGPPGTGKTTTIAETIMHAVLDGEKVLACAPSNTAVDNLLERLVALLPNVVRVGHPARVFEGLRRHTLDERVESDPSSRVVQEMRREVDQLTRAASRDFRGRDGARRRRELFAEAGQLRGQIRSLERSIIRSVLDGADVICTTTTVDEDLLGKRLFDLVVIDEACQCTEPGVWQAILRGNRVIFAGDHCQLPPTILSDEAARDGMNCSMMQRLVQRDGEAVFRRLTVQYRMNEAIMKFSSREFYDGSLVADASVRRHSLQDVPGVEATEITADVLEMIDTAGASFQEEVEAEGSSKLNPQEAKLVIRLVDELIESGVAAEEIAVIAPYAAQSRYLRLRLDIPGLQIDTVDGFQGREKDAVVITMVRSNSKGEIGFLADQRRMNVALTRARRKLVVIGDSATLGGNPFFQRMFDYFESENAYHSVWEYEPDE